MATNKWRDILRQAHSSRMKHAFTALVEIRKQFMKTPKDVAFLVNNGMVKRLLDLMRSRESLEEKYRSKVIDITLSILSNMCMEEITRKKLLKDKGTGVTIVVELFEEVEIECLQNRACRCLSNLLLDPGSWKLVCTSSVIEKIVKLLKDTEKEEYKQTCIRAIRLIGQTGPHVQKLVEKNAVSVVLKLIDCDTESLKQSVLRCVHSLSRHGSTLQFASQVIASGKLPCLLTLVKDSNEEAFQVVINLCEYHNFRAEFGNAGGISMFKDMFLSSEHFCEKSKEDVLSVLCLCCKEAVNRVKHRDENILILILEALSEDKLVNLHARIISALVCFLYDETSFDVLLENGLVPLLVKKLKSCLKIETDGSIPDDNVEMSIENNKVKQNILRESDLEADNFDTGQTDSVKGRRKETAIKQEPVNEIERKIKEKEPEESIPKLSVDNKREDETDIGINRCKEKLEETSDDEVWEHSSTSVVKNISDDENEEDEKNVCEEKAKTKPVYSIDSPTYQQNIEWEYQDYGGAKCIERFTPPHKVDYSSNMSYSPLSNSSYYSPVESSPEYSSLSSPNTSPVQEIISRNIFPQTSPDCHGYSPLSGSQSPENFHPKYPKYTACGLYPMSASPESEKSRSRSPYFSSSSSSPEQPLGTESNRSFSPGPVSPSLSDEQSEDPLAVERNEAELETDKFNENHHENQHLETVFQSSSESKEHVNENLSKLKEILLLEQGSSIKRKKVSNRSNVTEYNILILLSRVSQMTNPTMHLVTKEVFNCLLEYMSVMEAPLSRCPRLLSRVFRNPVCFSKILTYCVPTLIFDRLLKNEDLHILTKDLRDYKKNIKRKSSYGRAEIEHEIEADIDRFSVSDDSSLEEEQTLKKRRTSERTEDNKPSHSYKGQYHRQEEDVCSVGKSAIAFLEDLSGVLDSNYGRGVVDRLLHTLTRDQTTDLCINVVYITWTSASRQYFFDQKEVLDCILRVLQPFNNIDTRQFFHTVNGLRLLVHVIDTKNKFQSPKSKILAKNGSQQSSTSVDTSEDAKSQNKTISVAKDKAPVEEVRYSDVKNRMGEEKVEPGDLASPNSKVSNRCCLTDGTVAMDTVFIVKDARISANRAMLVERSEIFAAMLEGHYSEAKMSEIVITESSDFAFAFLIHYLHGCELKGCAFLDRLCIQPVDKHTAEQCIELLVEANKYMVTYVYNLALECLFSRYIILESAFTVFKYAVLHRNDSLLKAAVSCVFCDSKSTKEAVEHLSEILSSNYAEIFLSTLREVLTE